MRAAGLSGLLTAMLLAPAVGSAQAQVDSSFAFDAPAVFAGGTLPWMLASGDLDGDGRSDIVVANALGAGGTGLSLYLNRSAPGGRAEFAGPIGIDGGLLPEAVAVADMDADGIDDLVVATVGASPLTGRVHVLRNSGGGEPVFTDAGSFATGPVPQAVVVADMNTDGRPDIVTGNAATLGAASVTIGLATGEPGVVAFGTPIDLAGGALTEGLAVGDLNADGTPDVVTAEVGGFDLRVWMSAGAAAEVVFHAPVSYYPGLSPGGVTIEDVTGDEVPDIVCGCALDPLGINGVPVMVNHTAAGAAVGAFDVRPFDAGAMGTQGVVAVDLDGDGRKDLATANFLSLPNQAVSVLRNVGGVGRDVEFAVAQRLPAPEVGFGGPADLPAGLGTQAVLADDFNGDGIVDLAAPSALGAALSVYVNRTPQRH